jgi:D-amino-acid dehydrogenase
MANLVLGKERARGARVGTDAIEADAVVVTAGAWAPQLLQPLGMRLAVEPQRGQIVHLRLPGAETGPWPVVLPLADHYLLTFDDSRVVVGATREWGSGFDYRITAGGLQTVLADALSVAPGLKEATILETRVGFRPMPSDGRVTLGFVADRLAVGNGLGASGLTIGPYAGKLLAELVLGGAAEIDLAAYRPKR